MWITKEGGVCITFFCLKMFVSQFQKNSEDSFCVTEIRGNGNFHA